MVRNGVNIITDADSTRGKRIGYYEKALEGTVVVKRIFLKEICNEWNKSRGEVRLANFLLGGKDDEGNKDYSLQRAQDELERKI